MGPSVGLCFLSCEMGEWVWKGFPILFGRLLRMVIEPCHGWPRWGPSLQLASELLP